MRRLALVSLLLLAACSKDKSDSKDKPKPDTAAKTDTPSAAKSNRKLKQVEPPLPITPPAADGEKTASGMTFKSLAEGTGATPGKNDGVKVKYSAWREDGTTFATTEPTNQPTTMWLYSTAPGFTEALQKMKVGGKAMFWLPPEIGYPGKPRGKAETLAYAVELVDIIAAPATPADVGAAPANATKTKDGVAWTKVKSGTGDKPRAWDAVELSYTGWDPTGKIFDSSEVHGRPIKMPIDKLPPVFADVVPNMQVGDRARLWFPSEMLGKSARTPTGTLTFELEMKSVTKLEQPPPAPPDVAKPPANAQKTPKGVFYKVLKKGNGDKKPTGTDQVSVHYTGWTTDGKRFDTSVPEGKPKQFRVTGVIAGWTDALQQMVVGDKWRVWIPEELAYKGAPNRPQGMLVFDVELLGIEAAMQRPQRPNMPPVPGHGADDGHGHGAPPPAGGKPPATPATPATPPATK
jgi:FKBP-type peptidyl-prolyl cis-trans isomerase